MPPHAPTTVVLARFDDLLAAGLKELIKGDPSLALLAADVEHRRTSVVLRGHRPNVAVLDAGALVKLAEVRELSARHPATRLVLLAGELSPLECAQALASGASACLRKDTESRDVLNAIHLAARGLQVMPRSSPGRGDRSGPGGALLTQRESEVLPLLQYGRSNAQIAVALQVGVETVRTHARNIYRKLGVSSRRELAASSAPAPGQQPLARSVAHLRGRRSERHELRGRRGHGLRQDGGRPAA